MEMLRSGRSYTELLLDDIDSARSLIELEVFLFGEDSDGIRVCDVLAGKVSQGVEVRYIHDNFGNFFDSVFDGRPVFTGFYHGMQKKGIKLREHSSLLLPDYTYTEPTARNHRKINLIDKKVAYLGGMNISEGSMSGWGDTQVRITGPAVQNVREIFLDDWNRLGPKDTDHGSPTPDALAAPGEDGGKILQLVPDGPDQPAYMMEEAITWLLEHAKKYVWFETPYFSPSPQVLKALKKAAARGIDIRVLVPEVSDMSSFDPAFRAPVKECVESGVKVIYRKPPFNHSKTFVCDDYITCVGSTNLDKLSLQSLYELNVLIYDAPTAIEHKAYLAAEQDGATIADQALFDSWDKSELFKQSLLSLFSHWL